MVVEQLGCLQFGVVENKASIILCMPFGGSRHSSLLGIHLGVKLLGPRASVYVTGFSELNHSALLPAPCEYQFPHAHPRSDLSALSIPATDVKRASVWPQRAFL